MANLITVEQFQEKYGRLPTETDSDWLKEIERARATSKMRILDTPYMSPGKCGNCGSQRLDRKYVDIGINVDLYGVLYICSHCLLEAYELLNMGRLHKQPPVAKDEFIRLRELNDRIRDSHSDIVALEENIREQLALINNATSSDPATAVSDSVASVEKPATEPPNKESRETKSGSPQPIDVPRPKDVPKLADILQIGTSK